jgi:hypothetical protein
MKTNENALNANKIISDTAFAVALTTIFLAVRSKSYKNAVSMILISTYATD